MITVDAAAPAIEIRELTRAYGSTLALDSVDLTVRQGELISLLGASGSGKSTLLRLIAGFDQPTSGRIILHGREVGGLSPAQRDLGMVFQNYALFPHMTVAQNISYGLHRRRWKRDAVADRVTEMLDRMRLTPFRDRLPSELSGGQQQRVAIARALAFSPKVLLMDEPLGALDKALRENLLAEIRRVHREFNTTILYVTHDKEEALILSDRIAVMDGGRLQVCDTVESLFLTPPNEFIARFVSGANVLPLDDTGGAGPLSVVSVGDDGIVIEDLRRRRHTVRAGARPGGLPSLAVRPAALRIAAPDEDAIVFSSRVEEKVFMGDVFQLAASTMGSGWPDRIMVRVPLEIGRRLTVGDEVLLGVDAVDAVAV